jgi:hypothetical protein
MKDSKFALVLGMGAAIVALAVVACVLFLQLSYKDPAPVRAFAKHRSAIIAYVASINAGRIPTTPGGTNSYLLLDVLAPYGLTHVTKSSDGSIHFIFESMPTDATPSLVYCPQSRLDVRKITPAGGNVMVEGKLLEACWFYCEADTE